MDRIERGDEAEIRLSETVPDLVILDWTLPGVSGLEICRRMRARETTRSLPVIMLTARGEESERVRGLSIGADDYVVKPFSVPELMARVHALLRRARPDHASGMLSAGDLDLDRQNWRVRRGGREVHMGPTEFRLLDHLMGEAGPVFSRAQLLDSVGGLSAEIDERTVDVHIGRLRRALLQGQEKDPIRTCAAPAMRSTKPLAGVVEIGVLLFVTLAVIPGLERSGPGIQQRKADDWMAGSSRLEPRMTSGIYGSFFSRVGIIPATLTSDSVDNCARRLHAGGAPRGGGTRQWRRCNGGCWRWPWCLKDISGAKPARSGPSDRATGFYATTPKASPGSATA